MNFPKKGILQHHPLKGIFKILSKGNKICFMVVTFLGPGIELQKG